MPKKRVPGPSFVQKSFILMIVCVFLKNLMRPKSCKTIWGLHNFFLWKFWPQSAKNGQKSLSPAGGNLFWANIANNISLWYTGYYILCIHGTSKFDIKVILKCSLTKNIFFSLKNACPQILGELRYHFLHPCQMIKFICKSKSECCKIFCNMCTIIK